MRRVPNGQVDIAIVEAGLGGARDATNVFSSDNLKLAIITAIGLEHQKALGSTLGEIAAAKAGITLSTFDGLQKLMHTANSLRIEREPN